MDLGSITTFLSFFIPLYCVYQLGSLAGIFSERSGVANVAIEGNMIIGAVLYAIFFEMFYMTVGLDEFVSIGAAILITLPLAAVYMMLLANITNRYMGDHIIVGTGMNLLAPAIALLMYMSFTAQSIDLDATKIQFDYSKNHITPDILYLHFALIIITVIIIFVSAFALNETKFGLRLKTSGENPYSLETSGVSVAKTRRTALYIAGLLSALAGIAFTTKNPGVSSFFFTVNGSGFIAIGIMILGQYKILGSFIASIVFAILIGLFNSIPFVTANDFLINNQNILKAIPFIIPIVGMMFLKLSYTPASVGKNFKKDQR